MIISRWVRRLCFAALISGMVITSLVSAQTEETAPSSNEQPVKESDLSDPSLTDAERKALEEKLATQKQQAERARQQEEAARTAKSKTSNRGGVFKPTEEISEDSPVPFPVDI